MTTFPPISAALQSRLNNMPFLPSTVSGAVVQGPYPLGDALVNLSAASSGGNYLIVASVAARNAISASARVDGTLVWVTTTSQMFQLQGGITNASWVALISTEMIHPIASPVTLSRENSGMLVDASGMGGNFVFGLPAAASCFGQVYSITKTDSSVHRVIMACAGADTINGDDSFELVAEADSVTFRSDGVATWFILASHIAP